jgi:hypothetical protein
MTYRSELDRLIERGEEARADARQAIEWFRTIRRLNREIQQYSADTLVEWAESNASAQGKVGQW